jgi:hypothetical protein
MKPPSAEFMLSSFSRKLADASLQNIYAPPVAAAQLAPSVIIPWGGSRTEDRKGSAAPRDSTPGTVILLGQGILDCSDKRTGRTRYEGSIERSLK